MFYKNVFSILILSLLSSIGYAAQAPLYRFEVIIFEYTNNQYNDTETWPEQSGEPDYTNALSYITGSHHKAGSSVNKQGYRFQLLTSEQLMLKKEARAIKRSSARKLLLHTGWIQSMHADKQARPIAFKVGKQYTNLETGAPGGTGLYSDFGTPVSTPVKRRQLEGTLRITFSRYLHVWTDLLFRRPHDNTYASNSGYTNTQVFRYRDHRRMRSKELHYIDNPSFGILIYALPVKSTAKADSN